MQIPKRKTGKFTYAEHDPNLTEDKFAELKNKLERIKNGLPKAIEDTVAMAAHGDFSENAGYQTAKARLRSMNNQVMELEERLRHAIIIKHDKNSDTVQLGHTVTVETGGQTFTYQILGSSEIDPSAGIISHNSPIGSALMGRRVGDTVNIQLANKMVEYKIVGIK